MNVEKKAPQLEDGFTRIANELLEAIGRAELSGREFRIMVAVIRKTYGYGKKADRLSHGQIARMIGVRRHHVCELVRGLVKRRILGVTENGNRSANNLWIQKDYSQWAKRPAEGNTRRGVTKNGNRVFPFSVTEVLPEMGHTKEKKEILQKKRTTSSSTVVSDDARTLTELLLTKIVTNHPTGKAAQNPAEARAKWPVHIDRLILLDKRTPAEIAETIEWCQRDGFWMANILSAKKLREKWDTLRAQMKRKGGSHGQDHSNENLRVIGRYARSKGVALGGDVHQGPDDPDDALPEPPAD